MNECDGLRLLKLSRAIAKKRVPPSLLHWSEDLAQDAIEYALVWQRKGGGYDNPLMHSQLLRWGLGRVMGRLVLRMKSAAEIPEDEDSDEPSSDAGPSAVHHIAMWRLQKAWEDFTPLQKAGLLQVMSGEPASDVCHRLDVHHSSLTQATRAAIAYLDDPTSELERTRTLKERKSEQCIARWGPEQSVRCDRPPARWRSNLCDAHREQRRLGKPFKAIRRWGRQQTPRHTIQQRSHTDDANIGATWSLSG